MSNAAEFDIGPLTWVKGEIDLALERADAALVRYAAAPGSAAGDAALGEAPGEAPGAARGHLHQAHGALAIVGLDGVSQFSAMLEQLLAGLADGSVGATAERLATARRGLAAIRLYLDDLLGGMPDQPLRLYADYRDVMMARGQPEPPPTDLFFPDLAQRPPRRAAGGPALAPAALATRQKAARLGYQRGLLKWLKNDVRGLTEMRNSVAVIEMTQDTPAARAFWWAALAFLEAAVAGALPVDALVKRLCARIDVQIGKLQDGSGTVSERLMRDVLYCVAIAAPAGAHVESVRAVYRLAGLIPGPGAAAPGAGRQPALRRVRERLAAAIEAWTRFCTGVAAALPEFHRYVEELGAQARELGQAELTRLADAILRNAGRLRKDPLRHDDATALEMATALLLVESALDNFAALGDEFAHQTGIVCARLDAVTQGAQPASAELPNLDEISRHAREHLLVGQVVREILVNLGGIEQTLDAFFREPAHTAELAGLAKPVKQIQGALAMLGQARAAAVLAEAERAIADFAQPGYVPDREQFAAVAAKLSALGFFVERLQSGPADIDAILSPAPPGAPEDAATPSVEDELAAMRRMTQTLAGFLHEKPEDAALRGEIRQNLETMREDARLVDDAALERQAEKAIAAIDAGQPTAHIEAAVAGMAPPLPAAPEPSPEVRRLAGAGSAQIDAELLAIFVEEAHEVLAASAAAYPCLQVAPGDREALAVLRRSFHTLKGSGRMVGLGDLGEAAWRVEQILNGWLQQEKAATAELLTMLGDAQALFGDWVAQLEGSGQRDVAASAIDALAARCAALKHGALPPAGEIAEAAAEAVTVTDAAPAADACPPHAAPPPGTPPPAVDIPSVAATAPKLQLVHSVPELLRIGELTLSPTLYQIYLDEGREHIATLQHELGQAGTPRRELLRAAHTLASISATTGIAPVHGLAHALEGALQRFASAAAAPQDDQRMLLARVAGALEGMLGAVAERRLPAIEETLTAELEALAPDPAASPAAPVAAPPVEPPGVTPVPAAAAGERRLVRFEDELDAQLLPLFLEECQDLLPQIDVALRDWREADGAAAPAEKLQRLLHTCKGSARMAGAMAVGELVHTMETRIGGALAAPPVTLEFLDALDASFDRVALLVEGLHGALQAGAETADEAADEVADEAAAPLPLPPADPEGAARAQLRVRAEIVDRLVNDAGEMAIARSRIEGEIRTLKSALLDLTENVIRLRGQLREMEIQTESQMQSRYGDSAAMTGDFDPLELDRYTRFQELTRMMAESVNDVATVQRTLLGNLAHADAALTAQARLNRELSQALMDVRMVPFVTVADRLHRVVRQTAKETERRANLDIRGGQTEIDRSVLERITASLEHLLRNAVAHGIETAAERRAAGKAEIGQIVITLAQEGNEIHLTLADDGRGLDLARIRARAAESGMLPAAALDDARQLTQLIFRPGFSTATTLSAVAGRGVGLDVVRNATAGLGGRIEAQSTAGAGTTFRISLPLTLAVTQAVLVRAGTRTYAIPASLVEQASELKPAAVDAVRAAGGSTWQERHYPLRYLPHLLGDFAAVPAAARRHWVLLLKGGTQRIALEVDDMLGNQEIVVKNIGPQLARIVGIAGGTVLGDGEIVLILDPVALAGRADLAVPPAAAPVAEPAPPPTVLVVDDSLTVRKITGRLLARAGYRVLTARDGVEALEQLGETLPDVIVSDIEMPRMDGFELVRSIRGDARLRQIPIVMVSSRIAEKHRNYAQEIGVDAYLGKPYDEDELLRVIAGYLDKV